MNRKLLIALPPAVRISHRGIAHAVERLALLEKGVSEADDGQVLLSRTRDLMRLLKRDSQHLQSEGILSPRGAMDLLTKVVSERVDQLEPSECCELLYFLAEGRRWTVCDKGTIDGLLKRALARERISPRDLSIALHVSTVLELEGDKRTRKAITAAITKLDFTESTFKDIARLAVVLGACTTRNFISESLIEHLSEALSAYYPKQDLTAELLILASSALVSLCRALPREASVKGRGELLDKLLAHQSDWSSIAVCDVVYSAYVLGRPLQDVALIEKMLDTFDPAQVNSSDRLCRLLASIPATELPFVAQCSLPYINISHLSRSNALKVAYGLSAHASAFTETIKDVCGRLVDLANTMNHRHAWECMALCKRIQHDALLEAACRVLLAGKKAFKAAERGLCDEVYNEVKTRLGEVPAVLEDLHERVHDVAGVDAKIDSKQTQPGRQFSSQAIEDDDDDDETSLFHDRELKCLRASARRNEVAGGDASSGETGNIYESFCRSKLLTMLEKMEAGHDPVEEAHALLKRHRDGRKEARRNADEGPQVTGKSRKKRKPRNEREKRRLAMFKMGNYQPFIFAKQQLEALREREMSIAKECWALRNPHMRRKRRAAEIRKNEEDHMRRMFTVS